MRLFLILLMLASASTSYAQTISNPAQPPVAVDKVAAANPTLGVPTESNLKEFRRQLITAATEAHKAGEITRGELFSLRLATMRRQVLIDAHQAVAEQVIQEGIVGSYGDLDWTQLFEVLKVLLPWILKILPLFLG